MELQFLKILQYYLEKISNLNLIKKGFFEKKPLLMFPPPLNWQNLAIKKNLT